MLSHGSYSFMFHRAELLEAIYDGLGEEDQARIHTDKKLESIEDTDGGVVVTCTDGSTYEGSIVLGADGVHSKTRTLMRDLSLNKSPDADVNDIEPFQYLYKTMWCSFPRRWEFAPGDHCITHGNKASLQLLNAHHRAWLFVYEKLEAPTTERVTFTEGDIEEFAAKHADMKIGDRLKVKDILPHRTSAGMANLEEGVLKHWSGGRIVLAGDACHKFTPNAGLGFNNALQDVVALVNELHRLLGPSDKDIAPSEADLGALFYRYQDGRRERVLDDYKFSAHNTRLCAWPNTTYWLVDQYVMPVIPNVNKLLLKFKGSPSISRALCLDFVEGEEPFEGKVPWVHPIRKPEN
ncbi:putative fad binding domain containing protein [Diaporthe ampelina]|uniref:Putative fad binding domain containing protein n=1 Tax=Diaporthe ampelina TaxID=1214573 RepID=A0A0G2HSH5_9PEZI|nr:putative fad binding domain containing protein [Diaporthe ampelina]